MASDAMFGLLSTHPLIVKRIMSLRVDPVSCGDVDAEQKWSGKNCRSVLKVLTKLRMLELFEAALTSKSPNSKCLPIEIQCECRMLSDEPIVSGSGLTMVCRLWRWPNLTAHFQLQALSTCMYPIHADQSHICINPYHYEKCDNPALPSVMVPLNANNKDEQSLQSRRGSDEFSKQNSVDTDVTMEEDADDNEDVDRDDALPQYADICHDGQLGQDEFAPPSYSEPKGLSIGYVEPTFWCSISYYELNQRVGAIFHASQNSLTVDGFTDPSCPDRFCLGSLSNILRNAEIENCRRRIGHGVRLCYIGGEVYAECLSENPVFTQSPSCNAKCGWHPATVCKIPPGCNLKIFNSREFADMLSKTVEEGFEGVYQLTRMCTIRMSFVKGWGCEYKRQTITSTPSWIEIHLNGPLQWLDRVMAQLQPPGTLSTN